MTLNKTALLRALAVGLCTLALSSSCMKKPELNDDDGDPVSAAQVQNSLLGAWGGIDASNMKINEFAYTEKKLMVSGIPDRLLMMEGKTVQEISENANDKEFTIAQQVAEVTPNNETKLSTSQRKVLVKKGAEGLQLAMQAMAKGDLHVMESALPLSIETLQSLFYACVRSSGWDVSCYNLTSWEELENAPAQIAARPGCEGLANCKWTKKVVRFDLVVEQTDEANSTKVRTKAIYTIKMSHDAPFLSRITDFCYNGLADVGNAKVPVTLCQSIQDFRRGGPESP